MTAKADQSESWVDIARGGCRLARDAASVVYLRSLHLAGGGKPAGREMALMVAEKCYGHAAFAKALANGQLGGSPKTIAAGTMAYYELWVRDNRRRLSRKATCGPED